MSAPLGPAPHDRSWPPRRIVTGHDAAGRSIVVSDDVPPNVADAPGGQASFAEIWSTSIAPAPVTRTEGEPTVLDLVIPPPTLGTVIRVLEMKPGRRSPMHRTETIDYGIVLEGEVTMILDQSETTVGRGDIVVQRGTVHAWENRTTETARMVFVLVDGSFDAALRRALGDEALSSLYTKPLS